MNAPAATPSLNAKDYKSEIKPIWCPGCGALHRARRGHQGAGSPAIWPRNRSAMVSGIGCSSRIPAYIDSYGFHGVHGRALAVATGLKVARPELTVLVAGGDGDGFSIGGNHFLHACRRNIDLTYIVMDNQVYGMTKGQASPTTAAGLASSKLTPARHRRASLPARGDRAGRRAPASSPAASPATPAADPAAGRGNPASGLLLPAGAQPLSDLPPRTKILEKRGTPVCRGGDQ